MEMKVSTQERLFPQHAPQHACAHSYLVSNRRCSIAINRVDVLLSQKSMKGFSMTNCMVDLNWQFDFVFNFAVWAWPYSYNWCYQVHSLLILYLFESLTDESCMTSSIEWTAMVLLFYSLGFTFCWWIPVNEKLCILLMHFSCYL